MTSRATRSPERLGAARRPRAEVLLAVLATACGDGERGDAASTAAPTAASTAAPTASSTATATAAATADAGAAVGTSEGCPDDMVRVRGAYCPDAEQICEDHSADYEKDVARSAKEEGERSTVSERCLKYREPSVCKSKARKPMDFCMDRYEYPNLKGELPALLVSWTDAKKVCEKLGKRLCGEAEFNFACEGEAMLPYTYGYVRDAASCNIDKAYRKRERKLAKYERCLAKPECRRELEKLDQRLPAGSMSRCVSPFGVYDLNGNINEWVVRSGKHEYPERSGLKGGWWGPVRGRCRPTVGFHKEDDYGYEEGFRCCKDAT